MVVDGSANTATVLTLSHWPHAPCPEELRRDLSAESALAYLDSPSMHASAEVVTNNHFDQDGLMSAYALIEPEAALARAGLVTEVAGRATSRSRASRDAARLSMAIAACAEPGPLPARPVALRRRLRRHLCPPLRGATAAVTGWLDDPGFVPRPVGGRGCPARSRHRP